MAHQPWHKEYPGLLNLGFGRGQGSNPNYRGVREPDYFDPETIRREAPMSAPAGYVPMDERVGPQLAPMESGVSPRQSGFTGSVEWDVMDGKLEDPLGGPDMGEDPSNVGDIVAAGLTGLGQWAGDTFGPQNYPAIGSIGFPDERDQRLRQTWRRV